MNFYGLADSRLAGSELGDVIEFFLSREQAEDALRQALHDEPEFRGMLDVVEVDLSGADAVVGPNYDAMDGRLSLLAREIDSLKQSGTANRRALADDDA